MPRSLRSTLSPLTSLDSGVFWIGELPYGTYFLEETAAPENTDYSGNAGKWFYLIVDESGVFESGPYADRNGAKSDADEKNAAIKTAKAGSNTTP